MDNPFLQYLCMIACGMVSSVVSIWFANAAARQDLRNKGELKSVWWGLFFGSQFAIAVILIFCAIFGPTGGTWRDTDTKGNSECATQPYR